MEESSQKRRERLQAMRVEASNQAQPLSSSTTSTFTPPSSLQNFSNPLIQSTDEIDRSPQIPTRFDFYTDPMAAFSGSKKRGSYPSPESFSSPIRSPSPVVFPSNRPNAGPRIYHVPSASPPPGHQFQINQSPHQSPWRSPIQFPSPYTGHIGGTPPSYTPNPNAWNRSGGGSPGPGFSPNYSSRGGGLPSPSYRHGGSPSPHSNSGRGNGWRFKGSGSSPRPGRSCGRGRGFYNDHGSSRHELEHFYIKAMVKDPWRKLKPILGNILIPRTGSDSWLPKSIVAQKKAKVDESNTEFKSQSSLAEWLAASFEEAGNDV